MAKILYSALVSDMRNKLNGSVMSRNRYGSYVRTKTTPTNPQTEAQQGVRSIFGNLSQGWRSLTEAQRAAWSAAAPNFPIIDVFGNPRTLSGNALFQSLNQNLILAGQPQLVNPPLPGELPAFSITAVTATINGIGVFTLSATVNLGDSNIEEWPFVFRATAPLSQGVSYFKNSLRTISYDIATAPGESQVSVSTAYQIKNGKPVVGQKIGIELYMVHPTTGQATVPVSMLAIVSQVS